MKSAILRKEWGGNWVYIKYFSYFNDWMDEHY